MTMMNHRDPKQYSDCDLFSIHPPALQKMVQDDVTQNETMSWPMSCTENFQVSWFKVVKELYIFVFIPR